MHLGRKSASSGGSYPACRPTMAQCTTKGVKAKKSSKPVSWTSSKKKKK